MEERYYPPMAGHLSAFWKKIERKEITEDDFRFFVYLPKAHIVELELTCGPDTIQRLKRDGRFMEGEGAADITDENYPVQGEGSVIVRFKILYGTEVRRSERQMFIHHQDFVRYCPDKALRAPTAAEALLMFGQWRPFDGAPLLAFIEDSEDDVFILSTVEEGRLLRCEYRVDSSPHVMYVAVCI